MNSRRFSLLGTRIPATHTAPLSPRDPSINSMDAFDVKHSVSREEFSALPWNRTYVYVIRILFIRCKWFKTRTVSFGYNFK